MEFPNVMQSPFIQRWKHNLGAGATVDLEA